MPHTSLIPSKNISKLEFYISVVGIILSIAGCYWGLRNKVELLAQQVQIHIDATTYLPGKVADIDKEIAVLQAKLKTN